MNLGGIFMEMMVIALCAVLVLFFWWRARRVQHAAAAYAKAMDEALADILEGRTLSPALAADDAWGSSYERLLRVADANARSQRQLAEEKEALAGLVADISHQTKTPLANIKLYMEQLAGEEAASPTVEKLAVQVEKLDFLLDSLVKLSRLETGVMQLRAQPASVADTLAEALAVVVPKAEGKAIALRVAMDDALTLCHDRKWTAEALANLLDNAVKYTPAGGEVTVTVTRQPFFTCFCVRDTGKGIAGERQGAIFNRFYREPEVHETEGVGLGLYLAREIVTRQGGYIEVESVPKQGSVFSLYLPNDV